MRKSLLAIGCLCSLESHSIGYGVDENKLLPLQVSNQGPTRISFEDARISDVFYYPEEAATVTLHKSGHVFVSPKEEQQALFLSVMNDQGKTQDMKLNFKNKQPDPILLCNRAKNKHGYSQPLT